MLNKWWRSPQRLRVIFLGIMVLLTATLGVVAWWLLRQDQQLAIQRAAERQEGAADVVVVVLEKHLSGVDKTLDRVLTQSDNEIPGPDSGALFIRFTRDKVRTWPARGLVYTPIVPELPEATDALFTIADNKEFKDADYAAAIAELRGASTSGDPGIRASALVRIARIYRKIGRSEDSIRAGRRLSDLGPVRVAGLPAAIAGAMASLYAIEEGNDPVSVQDAARALNRQLNSGEWILSQAAYEASMREMQRWLPGEQPDQSPGALAEAVDWLWQSYQKDRSPSGGARRILSTSVAPLLLQWKVSGDALAGFVANPGYLESKWLSEARGRLDNLGVDVTLTDLDGRPFVGELPEDAGRPAIKLASATALPWTVQVFNTDDEALAYRARRNVFLLGTGLLAVLILTGFGFVGHAISRELAVARFQRDFVSTVSHEFRTPLTTLCQLSELLKRNRVASAEDQQRYFELLHAESNRLRRLVEGLLNLGRIEAGKLQYRFEPVDAAEFVRRSASEFVQAQQPRSHDFQVQAEGPSMVRADRETLQCALWNLFENAVKYSPEADTVWVSVSKNNKRVEVAIRDLGVGIPGSERQHIFDRFVRGSVARARNIGGTGIGLAMAREIVRSHGGDISVESHDGEGSTFRVVLPALKGDS